MSEQTREQVLTTLRKAPHSDPLPPRASLAPLAEESMNREQLVARFKELLEAQTGVFIRASGKEGVRAALLEVFLEERITRAIASEEDVIAALGLPEWGSANGFTITTHRDYPDRKAFKKGVFTEAEVGITGADFGFAESATLCLKAMVDRPRLISLAPVVHIAILPVDRLVPTYEHMVANVFGGAPPSQLILITGPSMTGDIQATPFKGMHGPKRLIVILQDD